MNKSWTIIVVVLCLLIIFASFIYVSLLTINQMKPTLTKSRNADVCCDENNKPCHYQKSQLCPKDGTNSLLCGRDQVFILDIKQHDLDCQDKKAVIKPPHPYAGSLCICLGYRRAAGNHYGYIFETVNGVPGQFYVFNEREIDWQ